MATVEELVITLIYQSKGVEAKLDALDKKLDGVSKTGEEAQKSLDKVAKAEKDAGEAAGKAGDKIKEGADKGAASVLKLSDYIDGLKKKFLGFFAIGSLISLGAQLISKTLDSAAAFGSLSEASGETRKDIADLTEAFESLGSSQESAAGFMKQWIDARTEARLGGKGKLEQSFNAMGIKTRGDDGELRNSGDVLFEAGQKAMNDSGGDKELAIKRMKNVGFDEETAKVATSATREYIDALREKNKLTEEDYEQAESASKAYSNLSNKVGRLISAFGMGLMPIVDKVSSLFEFVTEVMDEAGNAARENGETIGSIAEVIVAPLTVVSNIIEYLVSVLGGWSNWAQTGGQVVYGFFTLMRTVWNACIGVINGMIAALEGLYNAIMEVVHAIQNPFGGEAYKPVSFGSIKYLGDNKGGAGAARWGGNAGYGAVRGSWGRGSGGSDGTGGGRGGGGRSRGGRRGGGGGRGGSGGADEPIYHSRYQGTADPKRLGMTPAVAKIDEDPAKERAKNAKGGRSPVQAGARQVAQGGNVFNITNSITVNAQGNQNASQIASKTADAVNSVSRRQAGAMV